MSILKPTHYRSKAPQRWLYIGLLSSLLQFPLSSSADSVDGILAVVNSDIVTLGELKYFMQRIRAELSQKKVELPPPDIFQKQAIERLVMTKIQLQQAEQLGIKIDDETLNKALNSIAESNNLSLENFKDVIEKDGYNFDQFREDIRNEITVMRLRQRQVDSQIQVSEREIDNYLATQQQQGLGGTQYRISHILISAPEDASASEREKAEAKAKDLLEQLNNGANFANLAQANSDGQQALEGGDLGWRPAAQIPSLFSDKIANMKKGDVSEIIKNDSGFHIIKLVDVRNDKNQMIQETLARHILLKPDELKSEDEIKIQIQQIKARLDKGANFEELARTLSDDKVSAAKGGELGWVKPGQLVPKFEEIMNQLNTKQISAPFPTQFGWHIVQVLDRRNLNVSSETSRTQAREEIRRHKLEEEHQAWLRRLRDEAYVEYRSDN